MKALALAPRGFVFRDVLHLNRLSARVRVEWRTRDVHPWDQNVPPGRRSELFRDQAMRDTDAATTLDGPEYEEFLGTGERPPARLGRPATGAERSTAARSACLALV